MSESLFKRVFANRKEDSTADTKNIDGPNPYVNARRERNDVVGSVFFQRNMWIAAAFLFGTIAVSAVAGLIQIGGQSKFVPYIVSVDKVGQAAYAGVAQQATAVDPKITQAIVGGFVSDLRLVTIDISLQTKAIERVYAYMVAGDPAYVKASEMYNNDKLNPFKRAPTEMTSIKIESIIQQTANSWQVDWTETVRDRKGVLKENPFLMRGIFITENFPHDERATEARIKDNPLGVYVVDYNMQRVLK